MRRLSRLLVAAMLVLMYVVPVYAHDSIGLPPGPLPEPPKVTGHKVSLGRQTLEGTAVIHNQAFPSALYINEGETVTFVVESLPPHVVTFFGDRDPKTVTEPELMAPTQPSGATYSGGFFSTGMMEYTHTFKLTFSTPGVYNYICILHPGMGGSIVVLPKGVPAPPAAQQQAGTDAAFAHNAHMGHVLDTAAKKPAARVRNADGTTTWTVNMGASGNMADTMAFYPSALQVRVGDTVKFHLDTMLEIHGASHNRPEGVFIFGNGPGGLNPVILAPSGDGIIDGASAYDTTGLVFPGAPDGKLTFTKAGVYHIHCDLHDALGMTMVITVAERDAVDLYVNDKLVAGAQIKDGVVYAPVRATADALGAKLSYDAATRVASVSTDGHDHGCSNCGSAKAVLNGKPLDAGNSSYIVNGRMYAPATAWAAVLGGTAQYDADAGVLRLSLSVK